MKWLWTKTIGLANNAQDYHESKMFPKTYRSMPKEWLKDISLVYPNVQEIHFYGCRYDAINKILVSLVD